MNRLTLVLVTGLLLGSSAKVFAQDAAPVPKETRGVDWIVHADNTIFALAHGIGETREAAIKEAERAVDDWIFDMIFFVYGDDFVYDSQTFIRCTKGDVYWGCLIEVRAHLK